MGPVPPSTRSGVTTPPPTRREMLRTCSIAALPVWHHAFTHLRPPSIASLPIGVCRSIPDAEAAARGGAAYLEVSCREWLRPDKSRAEFVERLDRIRASSLPVRAANSFLPGSLPCVGPKAEPQRVLDYAAVAFARAEEAGIGVITFGSGAARRIPEGTARADAELQFVAILARLAPLAATHKVMLCVEPLQRSETNLVNRVSEAHRLLDAIRHPSLGITADFFHMMREDEGPESIRAAGDLVRHVHLAEKAERTPPGQQGDDLRPYFGALQTIEYRGLLSIECRWKDLPEQLPVAVRTIRMQAAEAAEKT